ncbi:methylmalonyl-CoA epimerase [Desulfobacca acetoxidans]|uniref:Methylmalonyl-CoA epimerase n=1 Tax=Desulfobacca acetoxidans (strain ATCC 700848 / DSM 11109 / ASRB2) TaxID=880072 RepID=F2NC41_DESAR|nr:methylmalonyl-CoA epimerase [Desulfobacca acetoxidans]AEB08836.1 methylmalonyl-CoA epimerase [Desulfobacca acetoxidans DSM 11109]HAY22028.1 methylmalonyl-CoA epimerase [Desulfobacterales bacterium]
MKIKCISHLGIAVKELEPVKKLYGENLQLEGHHEEVVESQKVKVSFFKVGETNIELLLATSPESAVAKYIEKNGEGIHHVAFEVEDLESALEELKAAGVKLIDEKPREGAHGAKIAFIHPKATHGVLIELCQHAH